jgi:hypothetical protein
MLEETRKSYRVVFSKALLGKLHMKRQEGEVIEAGFV